MRIVLASNNAKKLAELRQVMAPWGLTLVPQGELGIAEADEPFHTFVENALAKARHAARASGGPALADDSGLCVDALGGEPGVQSAVYAPVAAIEGEEREAHRSRQDAANNARLLAALAGQANRQAHFVCVLVALRHADDPEPLVAVGRWHGEILPSPRGAGGFGYDPLFRPADGCLSAAELDAATKARSGHRGAALRDLGHLLTTAWRLPPAAP